MTPEDAEAHVWNSIRIHLKQVEFKTQGDWTKDETIAIEIARNQIYTEIEKKSVPARIDQVIYDMHILAEIYPTIETVELHNEIHNRLKEIGGTDLEIVQATRKFEEQRNV